MKSKTPIIVALVLVVAVIAYFVSSSNFTTPTTPTIPEKGVSIPKKDPQKGAGAIDYEAFTIVMDRIMGQGNWSDQGHQVGTTDGTLTVSDLSFTLKCPMTDMAMEKETGAKAGEAGAKKTEDKMATPDKTSPITLMGKVATVEIKKGLTKEDLETALASTDWINKPALHLTEGLVLKGFSLKYKDDLAEVAPDKVVSQLDIENISIVGLSLAASDDKAPAGPAGFLKALQLDNLNYNNLAASFAKPNSAETPYFETKVGQFDLTDFRFAGQALNGLDTLDPSGLATVLSSFSAQRAITKNFSLSFKSTTNGKEKGALLISVAEVEDKDVQLGKVGDSTVSGVKFNLDVKGMDADTNALMPMIFSADKLQVTGIDAQSYLNKIMSPVIVAVASGDLDTVPAALENNQTLADFFSMPYNLDAVLIKGMEFKFGDQLNIVLGEANTHGPYKAGAIPALSSSTIKGLIVTLNDDPKKVAGDFGKSIYQFGKDFGQNSFEINSNMVSEYDAKTGALNYKDNWFTVKDLFKFALNMKIGGLTPKQLKVLSDIPVSSAIMALMAPQQVFGDMSLNELNLKLTDQGLTDRLFQYTYNVTVKEKFGDALSIKAFREVSNMGLVNKVSTSTQPFLTNSEVLTGAISTFLTKPESVELSLKPTPPLNATSVMGIQENINKFLNSLNLTIKANEKDTPALKFTIPGM